MSENSLIHEEKFWKFLKSYESLEEKVSVHAFLESQDLTKEEFQSFKRFLGNFGCQLELEEREGVMYLLPSSTPIEVHLDFTLSEWLALQGHFPAMDALKDEPFHPIVAAKLGEVEEQHPRLDLFSAIETEEQKTKLERPLTLIQGGQSEENWIDTIEDCIADKEVIRVFFINNEGIMDIYPHNLIYLDGELSLVGEDLHDRSLIYFQMGEIAKVKRSGEQSYKKNFSDYEIGEFISSVRRLGDGEARLILKVFSQNNINLNPKYLFLGHTYMTSNSGGEYIWAASVEPSIELYEWLWSIRDKVEIVDPGFIKEEFARYCMMLEQGARNSLKKAS